MKNSGYAFPTGHYNTNFANAVVNAFAAGKKSVVYEHARYNVASCMKNVLDDVVHGCYTLKLKALKTLRLI